MNNNHSLRCISIMVILLFVIIILCQCKKLKLPKEVREVFQLHKYYRNSIRFCQMPNQPPAKRMSKLKWNTYLAEKAQLSASRCDYSYDSPSDMNFDEFGTVAQNIADSPTIEKAVASWFVEYKSYSFNDNKCNDTCMQYKQIVKGEETEIGCGVQKCGQRFLVVCNYSPAAEEDRQPYEKGTQEDCDDVDDAEY
ncbi:GLI pathoproteinsis- 1 like 2 [Schistosoma haematobium]|uniref:GLI pathoproteinsis- 1 like 2 n=1 Tax=Schistosoma haematobium TaxID=6185 RepID=A0A094ZHI3_SCHHA|nr:GLI pathoproteinsis- 1 like 2 [Schistosoma haematobium]KAH9581731.1 GLI pathoproteinsis- 1 like 2 [Schistosoma haematobium]CAH8614565.1 unnamed protein product [Schistosoma haematobium]CAH8622249.1 unnamed protein product [Schistosoma haematobium]